MKLDEIIRGTAYICRSDNGNPEISDITCDSRECVKGSLFVAVPGFDTDGHRFISAAADAGAVAVVCQEGSPVPAGLDGKITFITYSDTRAVQSVLAANFFRHPDRELKLVGITGTNGKTSIATLLYRLFTKLGYGCGLLSTIVNLVGRREYPTTNTTQDPITIHRRLREMVDSGCQYCFMEASSHSLHQGRVAGLHFSGAVFTNATHDHLDYHKTFIEYLRCKKMLFDMLTSDAFALINSDDRNGELMVQNCAAKAYTYSSQRKADINVKVTERTPEGYMLKLDGTDVWTRFIGLHNAMNTAAVYGTAILLGADREEVLKIISSLGPVEGRMEQMKCPRGVTAVVDYAHTPDGLENVLRTLREIGDNELTVVFGCGGNRDRTKRPEMGEIAARYADRIIVTSDNTRNEKIEQIIDDIKEGLDKSAMSRSLFITDRREAIRTALMTAKDNGIVLIAGRGHEKELIDNGVKYHLDDKEEVLCYITSQNI